MQAATALFAAGGAFLWYRHRQKKKAKESKSTSTMSASAGPQDDGCLGGAYTSTAVAFDPEITSALKAETQQLYAADPVLFVPQAVQGDAFTRLSAYRVNEPTVDPLLKVAAELAPTCNWISRIWSDSMVAFHQSLQKMLQVIDTDVHGDMPDVKVGPYPWQVDSLVLRTGKTLNVNDGSLVAFEIPAGGDGPVEVTTSASPASSSYVVPLGIHKHAVRSSPDTPYTLIPVLQMRVHLAPNVPSSRIVFTGVRGGATNTTGTLNISPAKAP